MTLKPTLPSSLIDCSATTDNELIVVEGVSAANAIKSVRNRQLHAVLPMQGKIPNAKRTSRERLLAHPNVADLLQSLHPDHLIEVGMDRCRYQRVIVLSDPDADGVHVSILLLLFMFEHNPALIEQGRLFLVRAPLYGFYQHDERIAVAFSEQQAAEIYSDLTEKSGVNIVKRRFKGIASFDTDLRLSLLAADYPARWKLSVEDCRELCQPLLK